MIAVILLMVINDTFTLWSVYISFRWGEEIYEKKRCCYFKESVKARITKRVLHLQQDSFHDQPSGDIQLHVQLTQSLLK